MFAAHLEEQPQQAQEPARRQCPTDGKELAPVKYQDVDTKKVDLIAWVCSLCGHRQNEKVEG